MNNNSGILWGVVVILFVVIVVLGWFLFATPAPSASNTATSTSITTGTGTTGSTGTATSTQPLSKSVLVTSPAAHSTVAKTFTVSGTAPGPWFFEAVFPIKVYDQNQNVIGSGQGQAQGDWMTTGLVTFTSTITTSGYTGPATLVLMRDNPSGLPENDDSVSIPITIQ